MNAVPYMGVARFARIAAKTTLVRIVLAVVLVALVVAAALVSRHPHASQKPFLSGGDQGMVVLDLSASISADTYSRIGKTLAELVSRGGRYGLVVFSDDAYEALPPGSPAAAFAPLVRYFTLPPTTVQGESQTFPPNPWTHTFTRSTEISTGLDLAQQVLAQAHVKHPAVVLISDLADDETDHTKLQIILHKYAVLGVHLRVVALNAAASDEEYFKSLSGAVQILPASTEGNHPPSLSPPATSFPAWLVLLAVVIAFLLGVNELRSARLRFGGTTEVST